MELVVFVLIKHMINKKNKDGLLFTYKLYGMAIFSVLFMLKPNNFITEFERNCSKNYNFLSINCSLVMGIAMIFVISLIVAVYMIFKFLKEVKKSKK